MADDEHHITVTRRPSSTDTVRKSSESRLLDQRDLRLVEKIIAQKKDSETKLALGHEPAAPVTVIEDEGDLDRDELAEGFEYSHGITTKEAEIRLEKYGKNCLPEKVTPKWYIFVSQLWQPMPIMIWLAIIIEAGIQNWADMAILLIIQFANASIGYYEITKAGDAVAALKASLKPIATVKRDGGWKNIDATLVVPGDMVLLATGSAIPADCRINDGTIDVDQAQLTGESLPVTMYKGDSCKMGSTVVRGEVEGTVEYTGGDTFFGKTAALLAGTVEYSNLQIMLLKIMGVLVVMSITLCLIVFIYLIETGIQLSHSLGFTVVLLVASIPLAIEIVTTTTLALGSKEMSAHGAIVSRLAAIEDMAGMAILCSDKTGTLTLNQMMIQEETPVYQEGETQYTLLRYAAMAAKWKEPPRDALDTLTLKAVDMGSMDKVEQLDYMPFDPIVKRTEGTVRDKASGKQYKTTKGAPHVLLKLCDDKEVSRACEMDVHRLGLRGIRSLAVARTDDEGVWKMLGLLTFLDPPRPDTKQTIFDARKYGVAVKMITGDHLLIAKETSRVLDLGLFIKSADGLPLLDPETKAKPDNLSRDYGDICLAADGFAQVFPEHKYLIVECLRELGYKTGMTGDGVNDAPALKRADVGVAVHGATDAARAAADIILTQPGLSTIVTGIITSRCIFARIRNFITYRIAATLQLLIFFFIAVFAFEPPDYYNKDIQHDQLNSYGADDYDWPEFFSMPVLLLMLITLLNDGTLIAIGYDYVIPNQTPERWNMQVLFGVGGILALVALISSLLLLYWMLGSWHETSLFQSWGLGGLSYGQITTGIYLKVSVSDFLTLFSSRGGRHPFWSSAPAPILFGAACFALGISTIIAVTLPETEIDHVKVLGLGRHKPYALAFYIWVYCVVWWWIQDCSKVAFYWVLHTFNFFDINNTGKMVFPPSTQKYYDENKDKEESPKHH
mmetsp:Transcript_27806/g.28050  ORF Transcript_27806/g.28050 Transcript_27806/m.28050 type:complete len:957 (+) Transcript_27806:147-3017(+)|eukprot:CAMPEP_0182427848 /NCGR_PEP_ID=MMETSP1167-20130531/20253_1 /TAXON_ID=2988 /ORGANISM="Mallomonas Sp, Strain CCMP3275" /LENGTH=956 /DNA_ID=CAMNT_0024610391 /DNA_START=129 /DNA_END=2999 /DNA_ORIENTATION=-